MTRHDQAANTRTLHGTCSSGALFARATASASAGSRRRGATVTESRARRRDPVTRSRRDFGRYAIRTRFLFRGKVVIAAYFAGTGR